MADDGGCSVSLCCYFLFDASVPVNVHRFINHPALRRSLICSLCHWDASMMLSDHKWSIVFGGCAGQPEKWSIRISKVCV